MRNWNQPGNIKDFVTRINALRHTNPALHHFHNLRFLPADSDQIRFYTKASSDGCNVLVVAVNLDPFHRQPCTLTLLPGANKRCATPALPCDRPA